MSRHIWWGQVNWISFEGGSNNWSVLVEGGVLSAVKGGGKPRTSPPLHVYVEHIILMLLIRMAVINYVYVIIT